MTATTETAHSQKQLAFSDLDHEFAVTRTLLERVPLDQSDWKPHAKSTSLGRLAVHLATLPTFVVNILGTTELDMATRPYNPPKVASTADLVALFDQNTAAARAALAKATDSDLPVQWTLKNGDHTIFSLPRAAVLRSFAISHSIHHRAQLGVYLRLLDIPLPEMYGPTADSPPRA